MAAQARHNRHLVARKFNRVAYIKLAKKVAGKFLNALVEHTGRKSGQAYATPVVAHLHEGCFYFPLPRGADTDWFLNIRAAGGGVVRYKGNAYKVTNPQIISASEALPVFSAYFRNAFKLFKIQQFLKLEQAAPAESAA